MKPIPLSALQHYLFCPRQCALIHNEQVWAENRFTAEGQVLHKKANEGPDEHRANKKILRHLHVASEKYNLTGICDIVEISPEGEVVPVEYKRGKPKSHPAGEGSKRKSCNPDEVQVCAQALCLEEMMHCEITEGLIFYGRTRRKTSVPIDDPLRKLTKTTISKINMMFQSGATPHATFVRQKCSDCSLIDLCIPQAMRLKKGAASWFETQLNLE